MPFLGPLDASSSTLKLPSGASDPGSGVEGQLFYNSTEKKIKIYTGSAWDTVSGGSLFRDDPLATNLIFAAPYNSTYNFDNIAPLIKGTGIAVAPVTVNGNITISTNRNKYYGNSFRSPSTGNDWVTYTLPQTLGTGNFTVEFWVYSENAAADTYFRRFVSQGSDVASEIQIGHVFNTTGVVTYFGLGNATANITSSTNILNNWYHIAIVRNSGTVTLFVNGNSEGTVADANNKSNTTLIVSTRSADISFGRLQGNLQDLRIYTTAKYTNNFTPPQSIVL